MRRQIEPDLISVVNSRDEWIKLFKQPIRFVFVVDSSGGRETEQRRTVNSKKEDIDSKKKN